jgi:CheY-like chemotaxis protein
VVTQKKRLTNDASTKPSDGPRERETERHRAALVRATTTADLAEAQAQARRIAATGRRGDIKRIAVADDEPLERELICTALCRLTVDLHQASNGVELLELIGCRGPFDIIVTDISMPRMSGLQALEAARAAGIETPFIVVSGLNDTKLGRQLAVFGSAQFLAKPFDLANLRQLVTSILAGTAPR